MEKLSIKLANYILDKGVIKREFYDVYQFGFQTGMEMISCVLTSVLIALKMQMFTECILFLGIFVPLRSYTGGLHLKRFISCYIISCSVQVGVLLIAKNYQIPRVLAVVVILGMAFGMGVVQPVTHRNRPISMMEQVLFKKRLKWILVGILGLAIILCICGNTYYLSLIALSMMVVVISMFMEKLRQK